MDCYLNSIGLRWSLRRRPSAFRRLLLHEPIKILDMSRIWRIAVLWLLALAVPAQGFAAAAMLNCASGHHGAVSGQTQSHHHGAHGHDGAAAADTGTDEADEAGENAASNDAKAAVAHGLHKNKAGSCSACASCCTAVAPPSPVPTFEAVLAPDVFQPLTPPGVAAFLTGGPQRPPRSFLA